MFTALPSATLRMDDRFTASRKARIVQSGRDLIGMLYEKRLLAYSPALRREASVYVGVLRTSSTLTQPVYLADVKILTSRQLINGLPAWIAVAFVDGTIVMKPRPYTNRRLRAWKHAPFVQDYFHDDDSDGYVRDIIERTDRFYCSDRVSTYKAPKRLAWF